MATDKEKTIQKTYRLPAGQVAMIEALARNQIKGATPSAVVRALLQSAIDNLVENRYVQKHQETLRLLGEKSVDNSSPQTEALPKIPES